MDGFESGLMWACIGLLAGITIIHARALQKLAYDVEFRKIVANEEVTGERD